MFFSRKMLAVRDEVVARPSFDIKPGTVATVSCTINADQSGWYPPVMVGAEFVRERLFGRGYIEAAISLTRRLTPDEYTSFLLEYYADGLRRFGSTWHYADIVTVLLCLSDILEPRTYLEIGVRRGRSVAAVASKRSDCKLVLFDMWVPNYAGMENPGPEFVRQELCRIGHRGPIVFVNGDSHETLPTYFRKNPDATFDLITVDGDHSPKGAASDLCEALPRLNVGGAVVFDDIGHPMHPELARIWNAMVVSDSRFSSMTYTDAGYGVGFAIRKF
jgi:predicted O-methyltransferase YrrM